MQGKTINGYTLQHLLNVGEMAEMWYAENELGMKATVKILKEVLSHEAQAIEQFREEAMMLAKLNELNLCKMYGYGNIDGRPAIIMEYKEEDGIVAPTDTAQAPEQAIELSAEDDQPHDDESLSPTNDSAPEQLEEALSNNEDPLQEEVNEPPTDEPAHEYVEEPLANYEAPVQNDFVSTSSNYNYTSESPWVGTQSDEVLKDETPQTETPQTETPEIEVQDAEVPKAETPRVETPNVETPQLIPSYQTNPPKRKNGWLWVVGAVALVAALFAIFYPFGDRRDALFPYLDKKGKIGFIDKSGKTVIEPQFKKLGLDMSVECQTKGYVRVFCDGLAAVSNGRKWGFINRKGDYVIDPKFDEAYAFSEGLAAVEKETLPSVLFRDRLQLSSAM